MKQQELDDWGDLQGLRLLGAALAGAKEVRKANTNRATHGLSALTLPGMEAILTAPAKAMESAYAKELVSEYKRVVPADIQAWFKAIPGFGDGVLSARLIGYVGDPRWAEPQFWEGTELIDGEPFERTVSQLWAYCGAGDPALSQCHGYKTDSRDAKLATGKRSTARAVLYTWSSSLIRQVGQYPDGAAAQSKYYKMFVEVRADAAGHDGKCDTGKWPSECSETHKAHNADCQNKRVPPATSNGCGVTAHREWGSVGSPWRPGHLNAHAHRMVHKELLRDLWVISG